MIVESGKTRKILRFFTGKAILVFILKKTNFKIKMGQKINICRLYAITKIILSLAGLNLYKLFTSPFSVPPICELILSFAHCYTIYLSSYHASRFLLQYKIDIQRKTFALKQLSQIITIDRINKRVKYLPTINILDVTSLYSWLKMRRIIKDYGNRIFLRNEIIFVGYVICLVFSVVVLVTVRLTRMSFVS